MYAVIMASGQGTRLWPLSRQNNPKQFHPLVGDKPLIRETYERLLKKFKKEDIYITVTENYADQAKEQLSELPKENFIIEPFATGTVSAIGLALAVISKRDPEGKLLFVPSDHSIEDNHGYIQVLDFVESLVKKYPEKIIMIGINPTSPDTGMGYIQMESQKEQSGEMTAFSVKRFTEKPDHKTAEKYLISWDYLWNSGMFAFELKYMEKLYEKFLPKTYKAIQNIIPALGTDKEWNTKKQEYKNFDTTSIDYGVIEKTNDILVVPGNFGWSDIGSWGTLLSTLGEQYGSKIIAKGHHININSENCLVYANEKLVATVGLHDTIIVDTPDALLICDKNRSQEVKDLIEELKKQGKHQYL